ncbi:DNA-methyltransferase [Tateyamaria sp.]|uniref:DNA-methyltransferase n=1 Tax=Tateyamaria sp. TaxID=1929288 RepID=UPI003B20C8F3
MTRPPSAPVTLRCGDCLTLLPELAGEFGPFDHIITDPPYESVHHDHHARASIRRTDGLAAPRGVSFDGIDAIRDRAAREMVCAARGWVLVFCLAEGVRAWRDALQAAGARWHGTLAWIKPDASPRFDGTGPARGFECIACAWAGPGRRRWNRGGARGVYTCLTAKGGHVAAKPEALMTALVGDFTQRGQIICDPFMGSGTTGLAALRLGRGFCGVEKDPSTYSAAQARLAMAARMPPLRLPEPPAVQAQLPLEIL